MLIGTEYEEKMGRMLVLLIFFLHFIIPIKIYHYKPYNYEYRYHELVIVLIKL